jgi:molybdopterin/thiamine biosynthesis adenylyltransferase
MATRIEKPDVQSRARLAGYRPAVLEGAVVLVVGAGALGQNVCQNLALSGVRELRLVDGDVFEDHNRSRSPLHPRRGAYRPGDSLPKASAVGLALTEIHVDERNSVRVADAWIEDLGFGAFAGVDVIAACVDSLTARAYLARAAMLLGIPIVDGGFSAENLGMTVYPCSPVPTDAPCWSCAGSPATGAFSCQTYARQSEQDGIVPAIQNGAAALGALCAEAVIELIHGKVQRSRRIVLDLRSGESRVFAPVPDPECAKSHRRMAVPLELDLEPAATAADLLNLVDEETAMMVLRDVFVERANCPSTSCSRTMEVQAPVHEWQRDPLCARCGGRWALAEEQRPSPDTIDFALARSDPRSEVYTLEQLGFHHGDLIELVECRQRSVRLSGGPADLFTRVSDG